MKIAKLFLSLLSLLLASSPLFGQVNYPYSNLGVSQVIAGTAGTPVTVTGSNQTVALSALVTDVGGTGSIQTLTVPAGFTSLSGCMTLIATAAWSTVTGGNIANAITASSNTAYFACYDGTSFYVSGGVGGGSGGGVAFPSITGGTNTTAAMVVGTGASLVASGTGSIAATTVANTLPGSGVGFPCILAVNTATNQPCATTSQITANLGNGQIIAITLTAPYLGYVYTGDYLTPSNTGTASQFVCANHTTAACFQFVNTSGSTGDDLDLINPSGSTGFKVDYLGNSTSLGTSTAAGHVNITTPIRDETRFVLAANMTTVATAGVNIGSTGAGNSTFSWPVTAANWYDLRCQLPTTFATTATIRFELVSISGSVTISNVNAETMGDTGAAGVFQNLSTIAGTSLAGSETPATGAPGASEQITYDAQFLTSHAGNIGIEFVANGTNNVTMLLGGECGITQIN